MIFIFFAVYEICLCRYFVTIVSPTFGISGSYPNHCDKNKKSILLSSLLSSRLKHCFACLHCCVYMCVRTSLTTVILHAYLERALGDYMPLLLLWNSSALVYLQSKAQQTNV